MQWLPRSGKFVNKANIDFGSLTSNDALSGIVPLRESCADVTMKTPVAPIPFWYYIDSARLNTGVWCGFLKTWVCDV